MTSTEATRTRDRVEILGVQVDRVSMEDAMEILRGFIASRRPHFVITADASSIVQAQTDSELKALYDAADLVTPDSVGVLWASKRFGKPIHARVSGVDIVDRLCRDSADRGHRIYFLGAAHGVAEQAAERLRLKYPGCNIVGARHGYFPAESDEVVAQEVAELKPDVLFVAMGIPRQEKFIQGTRHIIGAGVAMGVGGSFDVFSGKTKRAPVLFQALRLEWLWRLILNPTKISKCRLLPSFVRLVLRATR